MTKAQFEKKVKEMILADDAKAVDFNTTFENDGLFKGTFMSNVIVIRNHVVYRYTAYTTLDDDVIASYSKCLGA